MPDDLLGVEKFLRAALPHVDILGEVCGVAVERFKDAMWAFPEELDDLEKVVDLETSPLLYAMLASESSAAVHADVRVRMRLLQQINRSIASILPAVDLSLIDEPWSFAALVGSFRESDRGAGYDCFIYHHACPVVSS